MEAFRSAIVNHHGLRAEYLDDLSEIYKGDDEEWHRAFMDYHELLLEIPIMDHGSMGIGCIIQGILG